MSGRVVQNFRGRRALVVHPDDGNRAALVATLSRLGLEVDTALPGEAAGCGANVVLFDADEGRGPVFGTAEAPDVPLVAIVGVEAPSRLTRVVRERACAHIMKPVRASGVFAALFLSFNEHARRKREADERAALARRVAGRRDVMKAVLLLMGAGGVDDDEAFMLMRRESMRRRMAIEDLAREVLATEGAAVGVRPAGPPDRNLGITRRKRAT